MQDVPALTVPRFVSPAPPIPEAHQWTHTGTEVLCLKNLDKDGKGYDGFQWPLTVGATLTAPDWNTRRECGGGLHGWAWGLGRDGKDMDFSAVWLVFGALPADVIDLDGKIKAKTVTIRFVGTWDKCAAFLLAGQMALVFARSVSAHGNSMGSSSQTGNAGCAICTGNDSKAKAGPFGCIALGCCLNDRQEMRCAEIGCGDGSDGKLKADQWYRLDAAGKFVEC